MTYPSNKSNLGFQRHSNEIAKHLDAIRERLPKEDSDLRNLWNSLYFRWCLFDNYLFNDLATWQKDEE